MYDNIIETMECPSSATAIINEKLSKGWKIIGTFQVSNEDESYGSVLLGKPAPDPFDDWASTPDSV